MTAGAVPSSSLPSPVGVVGTGKIGAALCARLVDAGIDVLAFDVTPVGLDAAREAGATTVATLPELADTAEVVILSLPTSAHAERVVLGDDGLVNDRPRRVRTILDTTSGDPLTTRRIAAAASERGVDVIDAGVSGSGRGGGVAAARDGALTVMVGGDDDAIERIVPLLDVIAHEVIRCGASGAGHAVKSLHNLSALGARALSVEVVVLGAALGLDPRLLCEVIGAPTRIADLLDDPNAVVAGAFALSLASKDCDVAVGLAQATGVPMPIGTAAADTLRAAAANGEPDADFFTIVNAIARRARDAAPADLGD